MARHVVRVQPLELFVNEEASGAEPWYVNI